MGDAPASATEAIAGWPVLRGAQNVELRLFLLGRKPAVKLEDLGREELARYEELARTGGFAASTLLQTGPHPESRDLGTDDSGRVQTLFLGRDEAWIEELLESEALERRGGRGGRTRSGAIMRSGRLLGYPDCCASFFARLQRQSDSFVLGSYRAGAGPAAAAPGGVAFIEALHPLLNMFPPMVSPVTWFPCSFSCAGSLSLATDRFAALQADEPHRAEEMRQGLSGLTLVFERFLFVHLHDVSFSRGRYEYSRVSDALSFTGERALTGSPAISAFRDRVTSLFAAHERARFAGSDITLEGSAGSAAGRLSSRILAVRFPEQAW